MYYEIRVKGHLDEQWAEWFYPMAVSNVENAEAVLAGELIDQAALHGMLIKVRDLGLPLIAVQLAQGNHDAAGAASGAPNDAPNDDAGG
jgi:hypothetical protein